MLNLDLFSNWRYSQEQFLRVASDARVTNSPWRLKLKTILLLDRAPPIHAVSP